MLNILIFDMSLKLINLWQQPHFPGANELSDPEKFGEIWSHESTKSWQTVKPHQNKVKQNHVHIFGESPEQSMDKIDVF